jgi:hypothetical protein
VRRKWLLPVLVAAACFGPALLATLLYYGPWDLDWLPSLPGRRVLLAAPVPLPPEWVSDVPGAYRWSLIYARMSPCEQQCTEPLRRLRQVQLALGRDQDQVGRALWHVAQAPELDDPDLLERRLDDAAASTLVAALGAERIGDGRVYVVDPRGSVILSYPADIEQKELLRDLKRLLAAAGASG